VRSESLRMAMQVVIRNPGRSLLTVLGLAIGVAAFIAMVAFGQGARRAVLLQFEALGANMLRVRPRAAAHDIVSKPVHDLSASDVDALRRDATTLRVVVPHVRRTADLVRGGVRVRSTLMGTEPEYAPLHDWAAAQGGMFDARDVREASKVCVLGASPAKQLFGDEDPLGGTVLIAGRIPCRVIGVLQTKGRAMSGSDLDDIAMIPITTYKQLLGFSGYAYIELSPLQPGWLDPARKEAEAIVRRMHGYGPDEPADFDVVSPDDVTRAADQTAGILTGLLAGIAAVSLLVGGIGIMNIQLVAVAERTHEIGIRSAIGAAPAQILKQFLVESGVLAGVGATFGVIVGVLAAYVVARIMGWPQAVSLGAVVLSGLFGIFVGVIFGYIPALRAARLDPIVALRRE
jgi:putative ABC transport system permease protein